uniref:A-kinase anchoring protein 13 n=1 Tax=Hucho hucho TaxID=62062 RepID=A0A4W5P4B0_9TELE
MNSECVGTHSYAHSAYGTTSPHVLLSVAVGTEMMDSQLMGEFEAESKDLEADSWTFTVDKKYVKGLKKEVVKRQDVIYELVQTEMHHVRTLKIMSEVYSKGLQKEVQLDTQMVERVFPMLDELLELHTHFFSHLLELKRKSSIEGRDDGSFLIRKIGDVLVSQVSRGRLRFRERCGKVVEMLLIRQIGLLKKMSSTIVRRLGIPECILLVTQRITKYPVLLQRILQHTKENEEDHDDITQALRLVKEILNAVDSKVNEHDKKKRLKEVYSRTDSKSIQRMKSGQMFAREDLVRGRRLLHDGPLQLKNSAGRLKDVQAMLLSDVFVFLQEKDQKYVFASLDQRSTVISLQKLIVREVANEERGLFLITAGIEKPEMVEVLASTKEERNTWMQLIQDVLHSVTHLHDLLNTLQVRTLFLTSPLWLDLKELLKKHAEHTSDPFVQGTQLFTSVCALQAVVVQQDTFIEDQRHALAERPQEKQRSLEKQRQEVANLQRQQAAHADERRRREREWEVRESGLSDREARVKEQDEETLRRRGQLDEERQELQKRKEEYQRDLERLRDAQRKLDRDRETLRREAEMVDQMKKAEVKPGGGEAELSSFPATKDPFLRMGSKRKGKNLNPFSSSSSSSNASSKAQSSTEGQNQIPNRLMQLAKTKDKKEKKKKKGKGQQSQPGTTSSTHLCKENRAMVKVYLPVLDTERYCYSVV